MDTKELLENSFDYVLQAIDDLENDHPRGNGIKYSILHLWSGIELLVKYRLSREHWSLLISDFKKKDSTKSGFIEGKCHTVSFEVASDRLKNICGITSIENHMKILKSLQEERNKLEHFHSNTNTYWANGVLLTAWSFIYDFVHETILDDMPELAGEMFEEIKDKMHSHDEYVKARLQAISQPYLENLKSAVPFPVVECPECMQEAIIVNGEVVTCGFCKIENSSVDLLERAEPESGAERCPECENEAFVLVDNGGTAWNKYDYVCFCCFNGWTRAEIDHCDMCTVPIGNDDEDGSSICANCFSYLTRD